VRTDRRVERNALRDPVGLQLPPGRNGDTKSAVALFEGTPLQGKTKTGVLVFLAPYL